MSNSNGKCGCKNGKWAWVWLKKNDYEPIETCLNCFAEKRIGKRNERFRKGDKKHFIKPLRDQIKRSQ